MTGAAPNRRVFLIGFMGAGKTSVGRTVAARLGWNFFDLDTLIEERERKKIPAIFADSGESVFREMETAALREWLGQDIHGDSIVALGGGAFVQPRNRIALQQAGAITILLEASLEELKRRCRQDDATRPLLQRDSHSEARIEQLFASRRDAYALAQMRVETTSKSVDEVAAEIERLLTSAAGEVFPAGKVET